eukprot:TRINITY_DN678_c0_g3_i1.p1 TRINITY_DN678_c0_g3~~TRINITY_DN678_c0_g3_i1.p1  ORF type:complete len:319 (+),score=116.92 TRINITY_DN678_c0_g3_i1:101-1057(+)
MRSVRVGVWALRAHAGRRHAAAAAQDGQQQQQQQAEEEVDREELEAMRDRQRWQDRYEFSDDEIEEELRSERAYKEKYRAAKNWLRYYFNIFEEHDNLTERRHRWKILPWKDLRLRKALVGLGVIMLMMYGDTMKEKLYQKMADLRSRGGGADWPTHYIAMKEILEGKRGMDEILQCWEKVRDVHQRDWLLPLLAAQVLMNQVSNPPVLHTPNPSESILEALTEELAFIESDVNRMSAEIALHLHNLKTGEVRWPGRAPCEPVLLEINECIEAMANFKVHPELQKRLSKSKEKERVFYGGTGYFKSSTGELAAKTVSA